MPPRPPRRRCTECRNWYVPALCAPHQCVCSSDCRRRRRRKTARKRRRQAVQDARVEERARQQARRERRRTEQTACPPCHAPPSSSKVLELVVKVLESWDSVIAVSRATLERKLVRIAQQAG